MAIYCFKCPECGDRQTWYQTTSPLSCATSHAPTPMVRDYRAENVGMEVAGLRRLRENGGTEKGYRDQFLPTADDYKSPSDPDGSKGIRKWNDEHSPHSESSGRMLRPDIKRRSW